MNISFRVDASEELGAGHFVRCLVLADAIAAQGGKCSFFLGNGNAYAEYLLKDVSHKVYLLDLNEAITTEEDAEAVIKKMHFTVDWFINDHYKLNAKWEQIIRVKAKRILVLDDLANRSHDCDLLVDPGPNRQPHDYAALMEHQADMLLGLRYAILRPTFARYHDTAPMWPTVCRAHMFFGSGSSAKWLPKFANAILRAFPALNISAVGLADEGAMAQLTMIYGARLKWSRYIDEMAQEYSQCDIAIGSPGTATWERACVGLPSGLIATANNQISILHDLDRYGFCRYFGAAWELDESDFVRLFNNFLQDKAALMAMRSLCVSSVDGNGAQRILQKIFSQDPRDI